MPHAKPYERLMIFLRKKIYKFKIALKMTTKISKKDVITAYAVVNKNVLLLHINVPNNAETSNTMDYVTFDFEPQFLSMLQGIEIQYITWEEAQLNQHANQNIFNRHKTGQNGMSSNHCYQLVQEDDKPIHP